MNLYCKRCKIDQPHIKAGFAGGKQLYQCNVCGKRHIDSRMKRRGSTVTIGVKLTESELSKLDSLPGKNRSDKLRSMIDSA